jgi:hypothetical protein
LLFSLCDGVLERVDIGLFLVQVDLVVGLEVSDVAFFHQLVLIQKLSMEVLKQLIIDMLESLNVFVVVGQRHLLADNCKIRASLHI